MMAEKRLGLVFYYFALFSSDVVSVADAIRGPLSGSVSLGTTCIIWSDLVI